MNTVSFDYDEKTKELVVHYHYEDGTEMLLLGTIPPARAQRSQDIYAWADARAALLGLAPIHR